MRGANAMRARAVLGGWVLLASPSPEAINAPKAEWDEVRSYDTAWACEAGRREEAIELVREQAAKRGERTEGAALEAMLRYRCAYTRHPRPRWRRWLRKVTMRFGGRSAP
jgi:protein involved in temperature-dependent protein secretion